MNIYDFTENQFLTFILILVRISAFIMLFPLFDLASVPAPVKILLSLVMTMILYPVVGVTHQNFVVELMGWYTIKEMLIGFLIAFIAKFFFFIMSITGDLITTAIGLSSSQQFNPLYGTSTMVLERFQLYLGTLFFLAFNGHHIFIKGLVESFKLISISDGTLNPIIFRDMGMFAQQIMMVGIQLSAPILGTVFFLNIGMGIIGRAVPQVNVLVTSWALNIIVGLGILIAMLPLMMYGMRDSLSMVAEFMFKVLKTI